MEVINLKCTSCGAPISDINTKDAIYICPYCGSMLFVKGSGESKANKESEDGGNAETNTAESIRVPLCCVAKELSDNAALKEVINGMSDVLDENPYSDTIIPMINKILNGKKEAATAESFLSDYEKVEKIIKNTMQDGEKLILYKTAALFGFNKIKTGMFVTTERVGYIDGKKVYHVEYDKLDKMIIDIAYSSTTYWYPNGDENIFLSELAVSNREFGAIVAYIILRAYEKSNKQKSIVLSMK